MTDKTRVPPRYSLGFLILLFVLTSRSWADSAASDLPVLVSTDWVAQNLDRLQLIDVRSPDAFLKGHLPGAVKMDWRLFTDRRLKPTGNLDPSTDWLKSLLEKMGISSKTPTVVYSDPPENWGEEGRAFWMLEYLGHPHVAVMDGGWPKWWNEGRAVQREKSRPRKASFFPFIDSRRVVDRQEIRRRLKDPGFVIVDARDHYEFAGAIAFSVCRGGHIPGAVNVPWSSLLDERGCLLPRISLREVFRSRKILPERDVVLYCTAGIRSGFVYFVLRLLGYPRVRNYPGSMWEWAAEKNLPLEK